MLPVSYLLLLVAGEGSSLSLLAADGLKEEQTVWSSGVYRRTVRRGKGREAS